VCCQMSLRRSDPSSRGIIRSACVCDREASTTIRPGPLGDRRTAKKVGFRESYETRYIYLPEGYKRFKQYLHEDVSGMSGIER
jgi:hypothetical protein